MRTAVVAESPFAQAVGLHRSRKGTFPPGARMDALLAIDPKGASFHALLTIGAWPGATKVYPMKLAAVPAEARVSHATPPAVARWETSGVSNNRCRDLRRRKDR